MKIYTASKTKHADKWLDLKQKGYNIISTWINEAVKGQSKDMNDLCQRCIFESMKCDAMIVYAEEGEYLKGAFIEMGVALASNKDVYLVGPVLQKGSAFTFSESVKFANSIEEALSLIHSAHQATQRKPNRNIPIPFATPAPYSSKTATR